MDRDNLSQLSVFATVAMTRSFRAAAGKLGLSPSAVSQAIGRLERSLCVRLFERTTRSVQLTPEGESLFADVGPALESIRTAIEFGTGTSGVVRGRLRLSVPRVCARFVLSDRLGDFVAAYPQIELEVNVDDAMIDIVAAGYDAGIRLYDQLERDVPAIPLSGPQRMVTVAAPSLLDRFPRPVHPRDLLALPCIGLRLQNGNLYAWEFERDGAAMRVAVRGPMTLNDDDLVLAACRQGVGVAFLFDAMIAEDVRDGRLVPLLEDWTSPFSGFYLYHTGRRHMRPPLRAFIDWVRRDLRT